MLRVACVLCSFSRYALLTAGRACRSQLSISLEALADHLVEQKGNSKAYLEMELPTQGTIDFSISWEGPVPLIGTLVVHVQRAQGLKSADWFAIGGRGASDPFVEVVVGSKKSKEKTKTIDNNNDPTWDEKLVFKGDFIELTSEPLQLRVMDADILSSECLGEVLAVTFNRAVGQCVLLRTLHVCARVWRFHAAHYCTCILSFRSHSARWRRAEARPTRR